MIPKEIQVTGVGDREFGNVLVMELLDYWGRDYSLHQANRTTVILERINYGYRFDVIQIAPGQTRFYSNVLLTRASYRTHLVIIWDSNADALIYLATNQASVLPTWRLYKLRMWIEAMFSDLNGHGFDLEKSCLCHPEHLNRLMLAVSLVYLWLVAVGGSVHQYQLTLEIDRNDRRDLSIFRLDWGFLERRLALNNHIPDCFRPNLCFMSGS